MIEPVEHPTPTMEEVNRLSTCAYALADKDLDFETVYQELSQFNTESCRSIFSDETIREWAKSAAREEIASSPETQFTDTQHIREATNPLDKAIASRDIKYLYSCIGELAALSPLQYGLKKSEIKEAFGKSINLVDLDRAVAAKRREFAEKKPDVADIVRNWCSTHSDSWAYDEGKKVWRWWNDEFWQEQDEKENSIDIEATGAIQDAGVPVNASAALNLFRRLAIHHLKRMFPHQAHLINFQNGTLDFAKKVLYPFRKEDGLTYILPYSYTPTNSHPRISAFLEETIPDTYARDCYIAHVGLSLIGDTDFHNFLLIIGPPRSGKSTLLVLANLACGALPYAFAGKHLLSSELEGKRSRFTWNKQRIVCADEMPMGALRDGEEILKNISAHGGVEMRGMNKDEPPDNRWLPKLIFSSNDTPSYKDTSGAIGHRAIIIECPHGPRPEDEQNKQLVRTLLAQEVAAFATTCIHYALTTCTRGLYPRSQEMKEKLHHIGIDGNLLKSFTEERCILEEDALIFVPELYTAFREYNVSAGNGNNIMHSNTMATAIYDMHIGANPTKKGYLNGKQERKMKGIRLRTSEDPLGEETPSHYRDDGPLLQDKQDDKLGVVLPVVLSNGPSSQAGLQTSQDNKTTKVTYENNIRGIYYAPDITHISPVYEPSRENGRPCLMNGMEQPVETGEQQDNQQDNQNGSRLALEETAKQPVIKKTEKPCSTCGGYFVRKRKKGGWLCLCRFDGDKEKEV